MPVIHDFSRPVSEADQRNFLVKVQHLTMAVLVARVFFFLLLTCATPLAAQKVGDVSFRLVKPSYARSSHLLSFEVLAQDSNAVLIFESAAPVDFFIGERLVWPERARLRFAVDSMVDQHPLPLVITVVRPAGTKVRAFLDRTERRQLDPGERKRSRMTEFIATTTIPLVFLGLLLLNVNRRQTSGFFQFTRLFTWTVREDPMGAIRVTSIGNLMFYAWLLAFISVIGTLSLNSSGAWMGKYFGTSGQIFAMLVVFLTFRMFIISLMSGVYGLGIGVGQFYGFIRLLVLVLVISVSVYLLAFVFTFEPASVHRMVWWIWLVGVWAYFLIALVRLIGSNPARSLHLFSYLCITEIIPLSVFTGLLQSQANLDLR